ncbi:BLUF domain-containing protein [Roseibacterium sp. KMU-115]|uniref:BLUF domain-containing protein n=1 Tax=Roseicyclus persicicus TaxID=2650661 RepID=A0A7X6GW83_9RHOB|nr:BLUF domain-containing protein [Roseibacterium persicicum]
MPDLVQLIYTSRPFGFDEASLAGVLLDARRCNSRDGITGALICRHDIYLQLLEGRPSAVRAAFARIRRDDRHVEVRLLSSEPVAVRLFPDWAMLHDPVQSLMWSQTADAADLTERIRPAEARQVFEALAAQARRGR